MIIKNINHDASYHTEKIAVMFFPLEKLKTDGDDNVVIETKKENNSSVKEIEFSPVKVREAAKVVIAAIKDCY